MDEIEIKISPRRNESDELKDIIKELA